MFNIKVIIGILLIQIYWIWYNNLLPILLDGDFFSFFLHMIVPIFISLLAIGAKAAAKKLDYDE